MSNTEKGTNMKYIALVRTEGRKIGILFLMENGRFSPEFPDAVQFASVREAKKAANTSRTKHKLDVVFEIHGDNYGQCACCPSWVDNC